jgi:hypothetical protein
VGADREALIKSLFLLGRLAVLRNGAAIEGYAALRAFGRGEVCGPVIARNPDDAEDLLTFLFASRPGAFLRVDTGPETTLVEWLTARGLVHAGDGVVMSRNAAARRSPSLFHKFALASQALG